MFVARLLWLALLCALLPAPQAASAAQPAYPEVMFILDASGSMWGQAGGQTKIEAARQVLGKVVPALPPEVTAGLTAYGHRRKGDCADVEVLIPIGSADRQTLLIKVEELQPKGKTPLAASVGLVAQGLKAHENETTIVLVTDGIETCDNDPCGAVRALKDSGIKFVLHVVGFDVDDKAKAQLECMARAGGGRYFAAVDAAGLADALEAVNKQVAQKVAQAKTTKTKAVSKLGKLRITMPQGSAKGLAKVRIQRPGGKVVKEMDAADDSVHPLLAGDYEVVLGYANPNYREPSWARPVAVTVAGGQTARLALGAVVVNIAKELTGAVHQVGLASGGQPYMTQDGSDNDYYLFKPKPVPAGAYDLLFTYGGQETKPWPVARGVVVEADQAAVVTLDSGLALKEADAGVRGWDALPAGEQAPVVEVRRRWDNDFPLWKAFPLPPGSYDLRVWIEDMEQPLPVGQGVRVNKGETVVFDAGL